MPSDIKSTSSGIAIQDLGLSFGQTEVLKGVNLEIKPGELFTFLGPSGSGKSTLLRAIAGFGPKPSGRILIGDDNVAGLPPWQRNVGMVFQSYALWPHMTVHKNVAFGLEEKRFPAAEIGRRVDAALLLVGLLDLAQRRPSQLSGGQQQRVALARTIVVEPRVLLLDEPLSNLDANLRTQMRREIHDLQRKIGLTTIFVTHDQEEANTMSDRIAVLNDGVVQQVGTPMELYDTPANRFVASFLGTANLIDGRIEKSGGKPVFRSKGGTVLPARDTSLKVNQECTAMLRPQSLHIAASAKKKSRGAEGLAGSVEHREFLGNIIRYAVRVNDQIMHVDEPHHMGDTAFDTGDKVSLTPREKSTQFLRN